MCPGDLEIGMGNLDQHLDLLLKFKDINPQKGRLMAYFHWKLSCFAASIKRYVCLLKYYNNKDNVAYGVLNESNI